MSGKKVAYIDVTKEWINGETNKQIKKYNIGDKFYFNNKKYIIDNRLVKYQFDEDEEKFGKWLASKTNKRIILMPKINYPKGIKSPDYRIGNTYYDLKTIHGNSKQIIYHRIRGMKEQAKCFIINASKSSLTIDELKIQIDKLFTSKNPDRKWVKTIMIVKGRKFLVLKKKR